MISTVERKGLPSPLVQYQVSPTAGPTGSEREAREIVSAFLAQDDAVQELA